MKKDNKSMVELTDEELLDLAGGYSTSEAEIVIQKPVVSPIRLFYGIGPVILYAVLPYSGLKPQN